MNFDYMPELKWLAGYPSALLMMLASAVLPYWFFKQRGWLSGRRAADGGAMPCDDKAAHQW